MALVARVFFWQSLLLKVGVGDWDGWRLFSRNLGREPSKKDKEPLPVRAWMWGVVLVVGSGWIVFRWVSNGFFLGFEKIFQLKDRETDDLTGL